MTYNGQGRIWTADTRIFSPLLYQLSYLPLPYGSFWQIPAHFTSNRSVLQEN